MLVEGFKWVPGFEGYYAINEDCKIISYWKKCRGYYKVDEEPQRVMVPRVNTAKLGGKSKTRPSVDFFDGIKHKRRYLNRLMAVVFLGLDPNSKAQVIHIDGDNYNNKLSNLRIGNPSERAFNYLNNKNKNTNPPYGE